MPPFGSGGRSGARSVEEIHTFGLQRLADLAAVTGADGTGVGHYGSGPRALDNAVVAQDDFLRHRGIADAEEDAVGLLCHLSGVSQNVPFSSDASLRAFSAVFDQSAT